MLRRIFAVVLAIASVLTIAVQMHQNKQREDEWLNNRRIETVVVAKGDTLYDIACEYKPSWLDWREYSYDIKQLNNLDSSVIYTNDTLLVYTYEESDEV